MSERLKEIIAGAIKEEEYFIDFYRKAAEKTDVVSAKTLLLSLSRQEEGHRDRLLDLDIGKLRSTVLPGTLETTEIVENLMLTPIDEFNSLKDVLEFGINAEHSAHDMYMELKKNIKEKNAKHVFQLLADEEMKHKDLLINESKKLGIY